MMRNKELIQSSAKPLSAFFMLHIILSLDDTAKKRVEAICKDKEWDIIQNLGKTVLGKDIQISHFNLYCNIWANISRK